MNESQLRRVVYPQCTLQTKKLEKQANIENLLPENWYRVFSDFRIRKKNINNNKNNL